MTQVASKAVSGGDANVAIGIKLPDGTNSTAAIVHLVLFGPGTDAPWEVVGTDDRTFTLDRPAYGSTAPSPVTVGGTITGVDESIRVTVHTLSAQLPVGAFCCRAAGGTRSSWSASVAFLATPGQVITIAAATGRHRRARRRGGAVRRHRHPRRLTTIPRSKGLLAVVAHCGGAWRHRPVFRAFAPRLRGGWINVSVIAVMAVAAVLASAWARSRIKPPGRTAPSARRDRLPARRIWTDFVTSPSPALKPHPARTSSTGRQRAR